MQAAWKWSYLTKNENTDQQGKGRVHMTQPPTQTGHESRAISVKSGRGHIASMEGPDTGIKTTWHGRENGGRRE
jgi:hypothetical protein